MNSARILVVDDELQIRQLLQTGLQGYGYIVELAADGAEALAKARDWQPDVIVLDLELPGMGGIDVCRAIRAWSSVPIIVLTVRDAVHDKISALDQGADDYLTKPFSLGELLARIRVAQRHITLIGATNEPVRTFGDLRLDLLHRQVYLAGDELHLTPTEYELLKLLTTHAGKVLTHTLLLREVWGPAYQHDTQTLRVFVAQLRRKLGDDPARPRYILTEPGIGYRFRAPH
ncbi:MAG: response regulator transcription factor [Kouleothrix sp.]|jgi:two-component system KDP operon response regulator KdpE|nr:response regulator transcription factor [Kouleothrix sp.]